MGSLNKLKEVIPPLLHREKHIFVVIKVSKFCNLRCTYCYEFESLGDKTRMSIQSLQSLFENIRSSVQYSEASGLNFIWHGGEPFLLPVDFFKSVAVIQRKIFEGSVRVHNEVQTNLTVLSNAYIEFINTGFFDSLGFSFDGVGGHRVSKNGASRDKIILNNLAKIKELDISLGAITVVTSSNFKHASDIFDFFNSIKIDFKFIPFYRHASQVQFEAHQLSNDDFAKAMIAVFDRWIHSAAPILVNPLDECISYAMRFIAGNRSEAFDKLDDERVFIVDVNGDTWGHEGLYHSDLLYGNLFNESLDRIVSSAARNIDLVGTAERVNKICRPCIYFGFCPGQFVTNATSDQKQIMELEGCWAKTVLDYIVPIGRQLVGADLDANTKSDQCVSKVVQRVGDLGMAGDL